jgi:hypothetical protein
MREPSIAGGAVKTLHADVGGPVALVRTQEVQLLKKQKTHFSIGQSKV